MARTRGKWGNAGAAGPIVVGTQKALLIGVSKYTHWPTLSGPKRDVAAVAAVLTSRYGFRGVSHVTATTPSLFKAHDVVILTDPNGDALEDAMRHAAKAVAAEGSLLVYYAGHGYLDSQTKSGYWVPVNGRENRTNDYLRSQVIRDILKSSAAKHMALVSDSCFSGALIQSRAQVETGKGASSRWYARKARLRSFEVLAAGAYVVVPDTGIDGHSPFAYYFVKALETAAGRYLDFGEIHGEIRKRLKQFPKAPEPLFGNLSESPGNGGAFVLDSGRPLLVNSAKKPASKRTAAKLDAEFQAKHRGAFENVNIEAETRYHQAQSLPPKATSLRRAKTWCHLLSVKGKNPYASLAKKKCNDWRVLSAAEQGLKGDVQTLKIYVTLSHISREKRLGAVLRVLKTYEALKDHPLLEEVRRIRAGFSDKADEVRRLRELSAKADSSKDMGDRKRALKEHLAFLKRYPKSSNRPEVSWSAAELEAALGRRLDAARRLEKYATRFPDGERAEAALVRAANLFGNSKGYGDQKRVLHKLRRRYASAKEFKSELIGVVTRLGGLAWRAGKRTSAENLWRKATTAYVKHKLLPGSKAAHSAAEARYQLAEIGYKNFAGIRLKGSPKRQKAQLENKLGQLQKLQDNYAGVFPYKSLNWTICAYSRLADLMAEVAATLYATPKPRGLSDEDLDVYTAMIDDFGLKFENVAIKRYETTVKKARELGVNNACAAKALKELRRYKPKAYPTPTTQRP